MTFPFDGANEAEEANEAEGADSAGDAYPASLLREPAPVASGRVAPGGALADEEAEQERVSPPRRALRLAWACVMLLRYKGPAALVERIRLWLGGERGYSLLDIRELQNLGMDFHEWFLTQRATPADLEAQRQEAQAARDGQPGARLALRPLVSFIVPVYDPLPRVLAEMIESVLAQTYDHWELCLVDGASTRPEVRATLQRYADQEPRIRLRLLAENNGIAANTNAALALACGDFVTLLDHDDLVEPDLLYQVVTALNQHPDADIFYYDEDLVTANSAKHKKQLFKPDWSPELLLSTPFLTHSTLRRQLVLDAGGFDPAYDGTQDWELFLRLAERIEGANHVIRIPRVLYHWRMVAGSAAASSVAKPYVYDRQLAALRSHMARLGATDAEATWARPYTPRITWTPPPAHVSIIIPTKDHVDVLARCLNSIFTRTAYDHEQYEIILVDTGSVAAETHAYYATLEANLEAPQEAQPGADNQRAHVRIVQYEGDFNYSRACNVGARRASGDLLLFLNNDVEALDDDWLTELVRWSSLPQIGIVGAKLLYPQRRIQHAGVFLGASGLAGHLYYNSSEHAMSILGSTDWYRNCMAVTGALQMMRRAVYDELGGYDERYDISYSDVAICVAAIRRGYRVLYDPFVRLLHYESQSRSDRAPSQHDMLRAGADFGDYIADGDPYFSPHLSYRASWPRLRLPDEPTTARMYERLTGAALSGRFAPTRATDTPAATPEATSPVESVEQA